MKRHLLFAMLCIVGALNVSAQQDVTATYLTNADFSSGTPIDNNVCTYGNDMASNGTTYYGAQAIDGWTNASIGADADGYSGCGLAGAVFAYGGTPWLGGSGYPAPSGTGNAAGLISVWGNTVQYKQNVTLPAGSYTVKFKVFNATNGSGSSAQTITSNLFGFADNNGSTYYAPNNTFTIGRWTTVAVTFTLSAETSGFISMGYVGPSGSADMPHLFVDNVKILKNEVAEDCTSKVNKEGWTGASDGYQGGTINSARYYGYNKSGQIIYQTVSGLEKGTYEVAVYANSQQEWEGTITQPQSDISYVSVIGATETKEWINSYVRKGYPGDEKIGIYTISDVKVTDGTLTLSYNIDQQGKCGWHHFQIKSLTRVANLDLSAYVEAWQAALTAARATATSTAKKADWVQTELESVIDANDEDAVDQTSQEALEAATAALNEANTLGQKSIHSYQIIASGKIPDNSLEGWVCTTFVSGQDVRFQVNTWSGEGNNDGSNMLTPFIENWTPRGLFLGEGQVYYRLEGLNPGEVYYAQALVRSYNEASSDAPNGPDFFINDVETDMAEVGKTFTYNGMSGIYATLGAGATVGADGTLTLGVNVSSDRNFNWVAFKNVSISTFDAALEAAIAAAEAFDGQVPPTYYASNIQSVIDACTGDNYPTTLEGFENAITALETAAANAAPIVEEYKGYLKLKEYADALVDVTNDNAEANTTLADAINTAETNIQTVTNAEETAAVNNALRNAMDTYVAAANPVGEGAQFDLTYMLTNPDVSHIPAWTGGIEGWYTDQSFPTQNFQTMNQEDKIYMEYWCDSSLPVDGFLLYQKTNLPEGTYKMTAQCKAGWGGGASQPNGMQNVTFSANETDGTQITSETLSDSEIEFINAASGEVKIGLKAHEGNTCNWMGIGFVKLYKIASDNTEFDIITSATMATVDVTVEGVAADKAKKLDGVTFTITPDEGCVIDSYTVTYTEEGSVITITPVPVSENTYTFQMPAADVTITVVASIDKSALQLAIAGAQAFDSTTVPSQVAALLTTALNDAIAVNDNPDATGEEVTNATDNLNFTLQDVKNFAVPYKAYLELKEYADYNVAAANDNATANTTFAAAIETAENAITTVTNHDDADDVNEALRTAMDTYVATVNPVGEGKFWLTYKLTNPDLTPFYTGDHGVHPEGWTTEQSDGNYQVIPSEDAANEDGIHKYCYEYWSETAKNNGVFNLYTSVTLPEGTYNMSCYAFASPNNVEGATNNQVYFYANDTQGSLVASTHLAPQSVEFVNDTEQEVKIGLKSLEGNQYRWMGIGYVELYKVPAKEIVIDQDDPMTIPGVDDYSGYDYTLEKAGKVILRRDIYARYNAVVLPFSMTQQEVEDAFGQDSKVYIVTGYNSGTDVLSFAERDGLQANQPCLLLATEAGTEFEIEGRTLVPCENAYPEYAPNSTAKMVGVYAETAVVPDYGLYIKGGNFVYQPAGSSYNVYMTRAYVIIDGWTPDASGIKSLNIQFGDGEATGIALIEDGGLNILTGKVYDLSGREVKTPTKGVYIIDGRKVMIK